MTWPKVKRKLIPLLLSPFSLGILPALILLYFLPLKFNKYEGEVFRLDKNPPAINYYSGIYEDLNQDGNPDLITLGERYDIDSMLSFIRITYSDFSFKDEWIFKSKFIGYAPVIAFDIDKDQVKEVFFFTQVLDSIFLNQLDFNDKSGIDTYFIEQIHSDRGTYDVMIKYLEVSTSHITFAVMAGYSRQPRKLYRFSVSDKTFMKSEPTAIGFDLRSEPLIFDWDKNGTNEYVIATSDVNNYSEIVSVSELKHFDTCSYLTVYNNNLSFRIQPIPIKATYLTPAIIEHEGKDYVYFVDIDRAKEIQYVSIYGENGMEVNRFPLDFENNYFALNIDEHPNNKHITLFKEDNGIHVFSFEGEHLKSFDFPIINAREIKKIKVFNKQQSKLVLPTYNGIWVSNKDFSDKIFIPLSEGVASPFQLSVMKNTDNESLISLNNRYVSYKIRYATNPVFYWRHPIWFSVYMSVVLLLWLTQLLQKKQMKQKYEAERQLMAFRFRALKNQVDPHFTLNALNSIAFMQEKGLQEKAGKFLIKFSRMIQRTLENSDKIETTLEEELAFVRDYLDVQGMRFSNEFSYEMIIEEDSLYNLIIPRHLVHTFVENALKHGLRQIRNPGKILIHVYRKPKEVIIEVDDNGIGRNQASQDNTKSTGKGLKILNELITLFNQLKKRQISYVIIDKVDESGIAAGTKIQIKLHDHEGKR